MKTYNIGMLPGDGIGPESIIGEMLGPIISSLNDLGASAQPLLTYSPIIFLT